MKSDIFSPTPLKKLHDPVVIIDMRVYKKPREELVKKLLLLEGFQKIQVSDFGLLIIVSGYLFKKGVPRVVTISWIRY